MTKTRWVVVGLACLAAAAMGYSFLQASPWETQLAAGEKAYQQGNYPEAEKRLVAALKEAEGFGPQDPRLATTLNYLGLVYDAQGKYAEAEPLYERSLAILANALGPEHPAVAQSLNNLALLYHHQGKYAEAEPLYKRSLAISEKALGPEHPQVATGLNNLAELYRAQGRYADAEPLYERALAIDEKALGSDHPGFATDLNNLALLYYGQGRYADAEPLYKRALAIREKALGPEHPDLATSLENYAALLRKTGRGDEAAKLEARAKAVRAKHDRENPAKQGRFAGEWPALLFRCPGPDQGWMWPEPARTVSMAFGACPHSPGNQKPLPWRFAIDLIASEQVRIILKERPQQVL